MTPPPARRRLLVSTLKTVGLVVLVTLVLRRFDLEVVRASWRGASPLALTALFGLFSASMALRIVRWGWQARAAGFRFAWPKMARAYLVGILLGVVTPMRAGELYRLGALEVPPEGAAGHHALAVASLVMEKVTELLLVLGMVGLGLVLSFGLPVPGGGVLLGVGLGLWLLLGGVHPPASLVGRLPDGVRRHVVEPLLKARDVLRPEVRWGLTGLALVGHLTNLAGGLMVFRLYGDMVAAPYFLRAPVIALVNAVPVTISGIGLREMSAMELFGPLGFPPSSAAAAAATMFVAVNLVPAIWLVPLLFLGARREGP